MRDRHGYDDNLPAAVKAALDNYLEARSHHEHVVGSRDEFSSNYDWQYALREADSKRREAHSRAARECLGHGFAPRLDDPEATLCNARSFVAGLLGFPV